MKKILLLIICSTITLTSWAGKTTVPTSNNTTSTSTTITWNNNTCGTNAYTLQYKETSAGSWQTINVLNSSSTTTYTLSALTPNTTYQFRVNCGGNFQVGLNFITLTAGCTITNTFATTNASCNNTLDGAINLTTNGGTAPYSYSWSNGSSNEDLSAIIAGTYTVTVTDNNGCTQSDTIIVNYDDIKSISQIVSTFIDTANLNYPGILNGYNIWAYDTLTIINTGCDVNIRPEFIISHSNQAIQQGQLKLHWYSPFGYMNIPYNIDNNGNAYGFWSTASSDSTGINLSLQSTQQMLIRVKFQNSAPYGTYTASWETKEVNALGGVIQTLAPATNVSLSLVNCATFSIDSTSFLNNNCNGAADGNAAIYSITNGSGQYSYNWSNGQTSATAINLAAGSYSCTVTDNNWGCSDSTSFTITEPGNLAASLTGTHISCNGITDGTLTATATGGSGNYNFNWSSSLSNSVTHTNLSAGIYTLTLSDITCSNDTIIDFTINEPSIFQESTISNNNTSCDTSICNGGVNILTSGGTSPYSIIWLNGDSVASKNDLCAGNYSITITDANTCATFTENITILDSISIPNISLVSTNISCNGSADGISAANILFGSGGTGNISTLTYCNSSAYINDLVNIELVRLIGDNDSIKNNTIGLADNYQDYTSQYTTVTPNQSYSIDISMGVFDNTSGSAWQAGAIAYIDWNIDGDFDDLGEVLGTISQLNVSIQNLSTLTFTVPNQGTYGATRLRVVAQYNNDVFGPCEAAGQTPGLYYPFYGATEDYSIVINSPIMPATYLWSTGDTTSQITNLATGTYTCTVTDTNGCSATDSVTITEPTAISTSENIINVLCNGNNNGTVSLVISGGNAPYSINWGAADTNNLSVGIYNYTITDNNGCNFSDSISIIEPNALSNTYTSSNANCNSATDGSIDITPSGGISPYTFAWDNGASTEDLTAISAGQYIVTITDANNCAFNDTITITEPPLLYSSFTQTNVSCFGLNNGSATVSFSGGVIDYTLSWGTLTYPLLGGLSVFSTPIGVPAGTYPYTVTDNNGCTHTDTIIITQPDSIYTTPTLTNVSCNGGNDGNATLNIVGGNSPYTEVWGSSDSSALNSGYHTFTITDSNGCISNDSIFITEPLILTASENIINVSCNGGNDGSVTLNISGGISPYQETWSGIDSTSLTYGSYTYIVTDVNGCTYANTVSITEPIALTATATTTDVLCNGDSTGTATLTITGGSPNYSENWNGASPFNLLANTYTFTVTDTNGCIFSDTIIINEPTALSSSITPTDLTSCLVSNGNIDLTINGGASPYTYLWNNNDITEDIANLSAGNYTVTISDTNGCITTNSASVNQPSNGLSLSLISPNYNGSNISCYNGNNGTITANTTGGLGILVFTWSTNDTIQNLNNLTAGNYSLIITDSVGCSLTDSIVLTEPSELSSIYTATNASCFGLADGGAMVNFSGGIQDYTLTWGTFTYPLIGGISTFITPIGVPAGIYPYTVTDINGCSQSDTITINQPDSLHTSLIVSNYNGNNISCNGFTDGSVDIQANGGTSSYTYYFNGSLITNPTISGLAAGTYTDSIIDNNGCVFTETITLTEPILLNNILSTSNMSCNGICDGTINTQTNGGTVPYSFLWNNSSTGNNLDSICAGNYTLTITDNNGCLITDSSIITEPSAIIISLDSSTNITIYGGNDGAIHTTTYGGVNNFTHLWSGPAGFSASTLNINNLLAGTYYLTTTDSTLCTATDSFEVTQPPSLTANLDSVINLGCNGICTGKLYITADGGDSVYTYLWYGPNGYTSTDEDIDSLCAGTYTLELSDTTNTVTLYFNVLEPTPVTIVSIADTAICYKGTAQANAYVYGGNYPYQTLWSNGSTNTSTFLTAGVHFISITDANGCLTTESLTVYEADSISINALTTNISCNGLQDGEITLTITNGGTAPFQYSANNGTNYQTTNTFYNLAAGTANFLIIDANGCGNDITATINQPEELISIINTTDASCFGECDGTATPSASGGNPPYTYDWGTANPNNLCAGFYNLIVTDLNGCLTASSTTISEPTPIIVNIWQNGSALEATPGFASYQWLDGNGNGILGAITDTFNPITQDEYSVEVIDTNGCTTTSYSILILIDLIKDNNIEMSIYPNPSKGNLIIESSEQLTSISVINSLGNKLLFINNIAFKKQTNIDLSTFAKGIYFIQIELNNQIINQRIILQ
jgi:hypothetical protein